MFTTSEPASVLVVAAHPDDEVLGCGGTIARHADSGDQVHVLIAAEGVTSRQQDCDPINNLSELSSLHQAAQEAGLILGHKVLNFSTFQIIVWIPSSCLI